MSKIVNQITVTLMERDGKVKFKNSPSLLELCMAVYLLYQVLDHNFAPEHIEAGFDAVAKKVENIEEVPRE